MDWLFNPTREIADNLDTASFVALFLSTLAVTIGVAGETAKGSWFTRRHALFQNLVVIGLAVELFAEGGSFYYSRKVQEIDEKLISGGQIAEQQLDQYVRTRTAAINRDLQALEVARKRADDALPKVGQLEIRESALSHSLGADEKRLADDEGRLVEARNELSELEEAEAPRSMEQSRVARAMARFKPMPVFVMTNEKFDGDPRFAGELSFALGMAGLQAVSLPSREFIMPGIEIEFPFEQRPGAFPWAPSPSHEAAKALCEALAAQKLDVATAPMPVGGKIPTIPNVGITIAIGKKDNNFFQNKSLAAMGVRPMRTKQEIVSSVPGLSHALCN